MNSTTTRVRGLYGTVLTSAAAAGSSEIDAGGEVRSWELGVDVTEEDFTVLADFDYVGAATMRKCNFSCEKLIVTDGLLTQLLRDAVMFVQLHAGRAQTATTGTGSIVAKGTVIITGYRRANPRGPVLSNVTGVFTGAVTQS